MTLPSVMLSPNDANRVRLRSGDEAAGGWTVTVNVQLSVRCWLSVTVQATVLTPVGNFDPLKGAHAVATGVAPPTTVGAA